MVGFPISLESNLACNSRSAIALIVRFIERHCTELASTQACAVVSPMKGNQNQPGQEFRIQVEASVFGRLVRFYGD
jgi:hypothetical protein